MGSPVEYWSGCNEKFSSIIKSTSLSLLLTTLIFLSVSSAPTEEPRRCHWCGPLAEQVHRSRRARACAAPLAETVCEAPHYYCATIALAPPYTESRLCVKTYQDECYPLYCNTTRTYKMTCPCRGDLCNGPNSPREETAFKELRQLAATTRTKRSAQVSTPTGEKYDSTSERHPDDFGDAAETRDTEGGETSISTSNRSEKGDSEINGMIARETHDAIVNESDNNIEPDRHKNATGSTEIKCCGTPTTASADMTSKTEHDTGVEEKVTGTTVQPELTTQPSKDEYTESIKNEHTMSEDDKSNDSNDILNQETYQLTTSEKSLTRSTETSLIANSDELSGGHGSQSSNEIPNEHGLTSTSTELSKQPDSTPNLNEITFDDIAKDYQPNVEVPVDDVNEVPASVNSNKPTDLALNSDNMAAKDKNDDKTYKETTKNSERIILTTAEQPNYDPKEINEEQRHDPSEANEIAITKLSGQDNSIQILDQKLEGTNGDEGTNFNENCNQIGTCNSTMPSVIVHAETTKKPETATESNKKVMATQVEIKEDVINKPTMATEAIVSSNGNKETATTQKPAITTAVNINKPAEETTTGSTTLPSKVEPTTESASTSVTKMSKQSKAKNKAFTVSGSFLLLANAFLVVMAL